jgi:hypothetical protein
MSKICFFEQTNVGFGISLNDDYLLSRLQELEIVLMAKNTEVVWRWKYSDNSLQSTPEQSHYFRAFLEPEDTLGKTGEYWLQIRILDNILGEKKFEIVDVDIHKAVAIGQGNQGSNVVTHEFEVSVTNEIEVVSGRYNLNILGNDPRILMQITNATDGHELIHNLNCTAVRCSFYDSNGQQDFNFLFSKKNNNKIVCVFPTEDTYSGKVLIEKVF